MRKRAQLLHEAAGSIHTRRYRCAESPATLPGILDNSGDGRRHQLEIPCATAFDAGITDAEMAQIRSRARLHPPEGLKPVYQVRARVGACPASRLCSSGWAPVGANSIRRIC